jgi:hypothetical protein
MDIVVSSSQHFGPATRSLRVRLMIADMAFAFTFLFCFPFSFTSPCSFFLPLFPPHIAQPLSHYWTGHDQGLLTQNGLEGDGKFGLDAHDLPPNGMMAWWESGQGGWWWAVAHPCR